MITSDDVPSLFSKALPEIADIVDTYAGGPVGGNYLLLSQLLENLLQRCSNEIVMPTDYVKRFFNVVEDVLENGDDSARDSISIEIGEGLLAAGVAAEKFGGYYGPRLRDVVERIRTWPKLKDQALPSCAEYSEIGRATLKGYGDGSVSSLALLKVPGGFGIRFFDKNGREITERVGFATMEDAVADAAHEFGITREHWKFEA
ncbi:MAG: hypothetical protein WCA52_15110 [Candidatus Aquilonibacter sp.]